MLKENASNQPEIEMEAPMFTTPILMLTLAMPLAQGGDAKTLVEKQVKEWKGDGATMRIIDEKYLSDVFQKHTFVAVHFPLWPVARVAPEPMKSQNLFAVSKEGKVTHLADEKKLEEFFKSTLGKTPNMDNTTRSWLRLRMEYVQDGYYQFKYPDKITEGPLASSVTLKVGVVEVVPAMGNMGSFKAIVRFNRDDAFVGVSEENKIVRGMRPRCQATLLLHPEKLVREIAEQDLLVMGRHAHSYLMEQRAKASPELQREIDRVWRQIKTEGR
jgi:hypothetical protein